MAPRPRILVIGLGNPILRDDSVGLRVLRALREQLPPTDEIELAEDYHGGLRLMERMAGFQRAIVIDAIVTGAATGTLHWLRVEDRPTQRTASAHDVDLPTALDVGRRAGAHLPDPEDIVILGIEAEDVLEFGETLSPAVEAAIPVAVKLVMTRLRGM
ncbi:MAG TPA: hydrogenase maturation protease [Anaerolineales bacterium]|nr:hydrogenase maturation protease [Anaerolineales bacterium]